MTAGTLENIGSDEWFPDGDNNAELPEIETVEVKGDDAKDDEFDIDVADDPDVPERDKKAKTLTDDPEPTDEEMAAYSAGVKDRIGKLRHAFHDQRRAAEAASRKRDEAMGYARAAAERLQQMQKAANASAVAGIDSAIVEAKRKYKMAADAYDTDAMTEAQGEMADLIAQKRMGAVQKPVAQHQEPVVQPRPSAKAAPDTRAQTWAAKDRKSVV